MSHRLPAPVRQALAQSCWTPPEARVVLDAVAASGLTITAFARTYGVCAARLYAWRRRLATCTPALAAAPAPLQFVEFAPPTGAVAAPPCYQLQWPDGTALRVEGTVDADAVATLVALLRGARPC